MSKLLNKTVVKTTLDVTSAYTEAVTNAKGKFLPAAVNETDKTITIANHNFETGDLVGCITAAGGTVCTAPATATAYYAIKVDGNTIALASSYANALAGTKVSLTVGAGSGYQYLVKNCFGAVQLDCTLPADAVITNAFYNVNTTFTSGAVIGTVADTATIALSTGVGAGDIKAAIAISDATNVYDAGIHAGLVGSPIVGSNASTLDAGTAILYSARKASSYVLTTAAVRPTATIAVGCLFGGALELYIEYVV